MAELLEQYQIGIPALSSHDPLTILPLTFIDISLVGPIYVRRLYFYQFPFPTHYFMEITLPTLKSSLSLTLQHFFPLTGNLLCPPPPNKPFLHCTRNDSVPLRILQSSAYFNQLASNDPKYNEDLDCLVPKLTYRLDGDDDDAESATFIFPLLALQVTVFPNQGLCIGVTYCHVMDDRSCGHFMKSWASTCKNNGDMSFLERWPPFYDRKVIQDSKGLEAVFLRDYFAQRSSWKESILAGRNTSKTQDPSGYTVKATLKLSPKDAEGLKKWVLNQWKTDGEADKPHVSKFVVACALVWVSLVRTRFKKEEDTEEEEEKEDCFRFAADCRSRCGYPIPETYFGNCISRCHVALKRRELKGEGGFLRAAKAIAGAVTGLKNGPFEGAEQWNDKFAKMFSSRRCSALVTGSPHFSVYETDFGFGRPAKVEMVH